LALRHHRAVVPSPGGLVHPAAVAAAELLYQPVTLTARQLPDAADAKLLEPCAHARPDAMNPAARQRPDLLGQIRLIDDGYAVRLLKLAGHLGEQLVGRHADRAGQAGVLVDCRLDAQRERPAAHFQSALGGAKVDINLI